MKLAIDRAADDEVDECWCVFDVEWPRHHPHLAQAIRLAEDHGIRLAISNPCFELWLILHLDDHTSFIDTKPAERRSRELDGRCGKNIDGGKYVAYRETAAKRAVALARRHERNGRGFRTTTCPRPCTSSWPPWNRTRDASWSAPGISILDRWRAGGRRRSW